MPVSPYEELQEKIKAISAPKPSSKPKLPKRAAISAKRTVEWYGGVTQAMLVAKTSEIKGLLGASASPIRLMVNSHGGPTGIAMTFYESMRKIYRPELTTVGTGDVDSSGVIIFLTGTRRFLMEHTTLLLHMAGRTFDSGRRITALDMRGMLREDTLKDSQYAAVVARESKGRLSESQVLELMRANTVLTPKDAVELGLADEILR